MSRLVALVPGPVCAAALGRDWPEDLDGQVRCIDEGTRSLSLAYCCAPWSPESEDSALRTELEAERVGSTNADPGAGPPAGNVAAGAPVSPESVPSHGGHGGAGFDGDTVAASLVRVPGAPPVLGLVSGPLTWGIRSVSGPALPDAVDAASDLASARVRALTECGVERVVVVESLDAGRVAGVDSVDDLVGEAHRPILRSAHHLRTDVLLLATGSGAAAPSSLGYRLWASADGCADGLGFLSAAAFVSASAAGGCIEDDRDRLASANTVVTPPLGTDAAPDAVRHAARLLAALGRESRA